MVIIDEAGSLSESDTSSQGRQAPSFFSASVRADTLAVSAVVGVTLTFMGLFYNRFLPYQEGWFHYYAMMMKRGDFPYKDFYFHTQPIPLLAAKFLTDLKDNFIVFRYAGIFERCVLVALVYGYFRFNFSLKASLIGSIACTIIYQSCLHDPMYSYLQTTLLFTMLSLASLQVGLVSGRRPVPSVFAAGCAISCAFFSKQSSGLFLSIVEFGLIFLVASSLRRSLILSAAFAIGWLIPAASIAGWLSLNHAVGPYLQCVFGGVSSKGSRNDILFGFIVRMFKERLDYTIWIAPALLAASWWSGVIRFGNDGSDASSPRRDRLFALFVAVMGLGIILFAYCMSGTASTIYWKLFYRLLNKNMLIIGMTFLFVYVVLVAGAMVSTRLFDIASRGPRALDEANPLLIPIACSATWMYSHGLSFVIDDGAMIPALGLVFAWLYDRSHGLLGRGLRILLVCLSFGFIFVVSEERFSRKVYDWWGWGHTSVFASTMTSDLPHLEGMELDPYTLKIYRSIARRIVENTAADEPIYSFPISLLPNYLTGRKQATYSPVAYFDVCPDSVALGDAALLRRSPPKVLIHQEIPEDAWQFHETAFRNGRRSGQREIEAVLQGFMKSGDYERLEAFVTPDYGWNLTVWVRRENTDSASPRAQETSAP